MDQAVAIGTDLELVKVRVGPTHRALGDVVPGRQVDFAGHE